MDRHFLSGIEGGAASEKDIEWPDGDEGELRDHEPHPSRGLKLQPRVVQVGRGGEVGGHVGVLDFRTPTRDADALREMLVELGKAHLATVG